jgi:hypothetical protein
VVTPVPRSGAVSFVSGSVAGHRSSAFVGPTSSMSDTVCGATGHGLSVSGDSSPAWPVYARAGLRGAVAFLT